MRHRLLRFPLAAAFLSGLAIRPAYASQIGALPWDNMLQTIIIWLTGDIARGVIIIAIAGSGIAFIFGEHGGIFRKVMAIVFGGSITIGAVSLYAMLGFTGATL